jgi:hypothetical protein
MEAARVVSTSLYRSGSREARVTKESGMRVPALACDCPQEGIDTLIQLKADFWPFCRYRVDFIVTNDG